jgi:hypothetical protein
MRAAGPDIALHVFHLELFDIGDQVKLFLSPGQHQARLI